LPAHVPDMTCKDFDFHMTWDMRRVFMLCWCACWNCDAPALAGTFMSLAPALAAPNCTAAPCLPENRRARLCVPHALLPGTASPAADLHVMA
jgi:hypothetical protein